MGTLIHLPTRRSVNLSPWGRAHKPECYLTGRKIHGYRNGSPASA